MRIKVVIAGGTGFVGQGIIKELSPDKFEIHSLSRHTHVPILNDQTTYHAVDLSQPFQWKHIVEDADWVIDAVGILLPNPLKGTTYINSVYEPANYLIEMLINNSKANFLFISANHAPVFMKKYLRVKKLVEFKMLHSLSERSYIVYPGIIFDKEKTISYISGLCLSYINKINFLKKWRPIERSIFSKEIEKILIGNHSHLENIKDI